MTGATSCLRQMPLRVGLAIRPPRASSLTIALRPRAGTARLSQWRRDKASSRRRSYPLTPDLDQTLQGLEDAGAPAPGAAARIATAQLFARFDFRFWVSAYPVATPPSP